MNEAVRNLWIERLYSCNEVGQEIRNVTRPRKQSSEQNVVLCTSGSNRGFEDLMVFCNWFEELDLFDTTHSGLRSLVNCLNAKDNSGINCGNAKSIEQTLQ